jgi:serine/threonine protein phosphatase PrpC
MTEPNKPRVPLRLVASGEVNIGKRRLHNEDAVLLRPDLHLYLVADGAGGHNAGNVASALATTSIARTFEWTEQALLDKPEVDAFGLMKGERRLARAIQKANADIVEIAKTSNKHKGMGTTIVALTVTPELGMIHIGHVGDSRCYRWRAGELEQLTQDHSLINDVLETRPNVEDEALARLPRNVVTRALGMDDSVRASVRSYRMVTGDRYLLCSDGLTDELDDDVLADVLRLDKHPDELVPVLIDMANEAGGNDNIAVLILACEMAPTTSSWPKRRTSIHPRPDMTTMVDKAEAGQEDMDPEIVIVGIDHVADVVPEGSLSDEILHALDAMRARKAPK